MRFTGLILTVALVGCARSQERQLPAPMEMDHAAASGHVCPMHDGSCPMQRNMNGSHAGQAGHAGRAGHGAPCPSHGAGTAVPTAPETSVPEAVHDDHGASVDESDPVERGRSIFHGRGNCHTCHGQGARGTALAPNLGDDVWLHADGSASSVRRIISSGVPQPRVHPAAMPRMGGATLSERDIGDLAAYVISLHR